MSMFTPVRVDGVVEQVDLGSGVATVRSTLGAVVDLFLPAHFGGSESPYPRRGATIHMKLVGEVSEHPRIVEAWVDSQMGDEPPTPSP